MTKSDLYTSDAGDVFVNEVQLFWKIYKFSRYNKRPVNPPYCFDHRFEKGIRIGTWVLAIRRTKRTYEHTHPPEWMSEAL